MEEEKLSQKSHYSKMIELINEIGIGFDTVNNDRIIFRHNHDKVIMVGVYGCTFDFDKDGKFEELLVEE